jgi:hypothetical protein
MVAALRIVNSRRVGSALTKILSRLEDQVTHVEIHLNDVNSDKSRLRMNAASWRRVGQT